MEKNGIMTKISSCFPENYAFSRHSFKTNDPKMCKDDVNPALFCSVPDSIVDDNAMDVQECSVRTITNKTDKGSKPDFSFNDKTFFSLIHGKQGNEFQNAILPSWNNNSGYSFSQNSLVNNNKSISSNSFQVLESFSTPRNPNPCESASNSVLNTDSPLSFVIDDDESSSSIEEIFHPKQDDFEEISRNYAARHVVHLSTAAEKSPPNQTQHSEERKITPISIIPASALKLVEHSTPIKDQVTPELPPPLICIDDDEESCQSSIKANYEVIDVVDSPEMPILTPFSSDDEEVLKIKQEVISEDEVEKAVSKEDQLLSEASGMRQPQVLLRRISLEQCLQFTPGSKNSFADASLLNKAKNSSFDGPEIEEIEGVRFFQFRSKQDMDEFNRKPEFGIEDLDMILPTKTMDITQIKGWRDKYFASESQLHCFQLDSKENDSLMSSYTCEKKVHVCHDASSMNVDSSLCVTDEDDFKKSNLEDSKVDTKCLNKLNTESKFKSQNVSSESKDLKTQLSAFISEDLDSFLKTKSELQVNYLQRINPNIMPIPPNAGILSLGKLKQPDRPFQYRNRRFFLYKPNPTNVDEVKDSPRTSEVNVSSPEVISMNSSDHSSSDDDDIPVAKLTTVKRRKLRLTSLDLETCTKRRKSDESSEQSERLVLRLTKESKGSSEGYKISEGFNKKSDLSSSSSSSVSSTPASSRPPSPAPPSCSSDEEVPDEFKNEGNASSIITRSIFVKNEEPKLLSEFIKNLNLLGTSKDVTMLVESNKSYFKEIPILDKTTCNEALTALLSNDELLQVKKPKSRRKLKTWQKYLPKKLTTNQKLKISKTKEDNLNAETSVNTANIKTSASTNIKTTNSIKNTRKKKLDNNVIIENNTRGKRSIKVPLRFKAGGDWVSPIFVDDPKKTRKQLLEVPPVVVEDPKKTRKQLLEVLNKVTNDSNKQPESSTIRESIVDISTPSEPCSLIQTTKQKSPGVKAIKSAKVNNVKTPPKSKVETLQKLKKVRGKKLTEKKIELTKFKTREAETELSSSSTSSSPTSNSSSESADENVSLLKCTFDNFPYYLPACACLPCSRTASFNHKSKELICYNDHSSKCSGSEPNPNALFNHTFSHEASEPVRLSIPWKENDSSDSILQISESIISNGLLVSEEVKNAICNEGSSSDIKSNKDAEVEEKCNSKVLPLETLQLKSSDNSPVSDKVVKQISNSQTSVYKSPMYLTNANIHPLPSQLPVPILPKTSNVMPVPIIPTASSKTSYSGGLESNVILLVPTYAQKSTSDNSANCTLQNKPPDDQSSKPKPTILHRTQSPSNTECNSPVSRAVLRTNVPKLVQGAHLLRFENGRLLYYQPEKKSSPIDNSTGGSSVSNPSVESNILKDILKGENVKCNYPLHDTKDKKQTVEAKVGDKINDEIPKRTNKRGRTRRKSPIMKRSLNDGADLVVDVETVDEKFNPLEQVSSNDRDRLLDPAKGNDSDSIFTSDNANEVKSSKQRQNQKYALRKNFERLRNSSEFFKEASSSKEVLDRALYAIRKYKKREQALRVMKHRLRIHNTRLLGKFLLCLQGIKDTNVRNLAKKQVIKNLAHDWVKQTLIHQKKFPDEPPKKRRKASNKAPGSDYEAHMKSQSNDSAESKASATSSICVDAVQSAKPSLSIDVSQMQYNVDIEPQMDFEVSEEPQADFEMFKDFQVDYAAKAKISRTENKKKSSEKDTNSNKIQTSVNSIDKPSVKREIQEENCKEVLKLHSSPSKEFRTSEFENKLESVSSTCPSQIFEDTPSDDNLPEDGPLIIDISDDENPIPAKVPTESIKDNKNNTLPNKDSKDAEEKLKSYPGLKVLYSAEIFEEFEEDVSQASQNNNIPEILR
ncbi:uncharacterized protein [Parasteatoda tepidariorum]|uniref:uncharacterized protein n=1 Tax=Parasteatoda tepidariorum TaxID=114398 RepID=UPI00077FD8B2